MPQIDLGRVKGDPLRYEDLTDSQKLELKGEKGDMPVIKAGTTTIVNFDQNAKVTSETNGDVTSFNFQIPVGQKPPFYGAYENFPEIGDPDRMFIDNTVVPRLMYTWDEVEGYVLTSGADGLSIDIDPENIDTYTENDGEQSAEYKLVDAHPIINGMLNKLAYFRTHASAVWYNKLAGITVLQKLDTLTSNIGTLSQLLTTNKTSLVDAVNELNGNITTVSGKMTDMFKTVTASKEYTVPANGAIAVNFSYNVPAGYKAIGVVGFYTGGTYTLPLRIASKRMDVYNLYNTDLTVTATITVLCVKN